MRDVYYMCNVSDFLHRWLCWDSPPVRGYPPAAPQWPLPPLTPHYLWHSNSGLRCFLSLVYFLQWVPLGLEMPLLFAAILDIDLYNFTVEDPESN